VDYIIGEEVLLPKSLFWLYLFVFTEVLKLSTWVYFIHGV